MESGHNHLAAFIHTTLTSATCIVCHLVDYKLAGVNICTIKPLCSRALFLSMLGVTDNYNGSLLHCIWNLVFISLDILLHDEISNNTSVNCILCCKSVCLLSC